MPIIAVILLVLLGVYACQPDKPPEKVVVENRINNAVEQCEKRAKAQARFPSTIMLGGEPTVEQRPDDIMVVKGTIRWLAEHATYQWYDFECTYQGGALLYWSYTDVKR